MTSFWLKFAVQELLTLANAFLQLSTLTPTQKADLQQLIADGEKVISDF